MADQVFRFQYTIFDVTVRLTEATVEARQGMRTISTPIARLQHLFVLDTPDSGQRELLLTWVTLKGRLKRARIYSDRDEPGFEALVAALVARRPDIDIREMDVDTAWATVGTQPREWLVLPAVMALGTLVLGVLFTPLLVHGFDRGHATATVAELTAGARFDTRNLEVRGRLLIEHGLVEDVGHDRAQAAAAWFPLVDPQAAPDAPVKVVAKISGSADLDYAQVAEQATHAGILRDVWWEGLSSRRRVQMKAAGVPMASTVLLLDLGARPEADLTVAAAILGLLALLTAVTGVALWRRRHRPPPRPKLAGR